VDLGNKKEIFYVDENAFIAIIVLT